MTGIVPLLVPAAVRRSVVSRAVRPVGLPLPLPGAVARRARATVYALSGVDGSGRISDRAVPLALGWNADTHVRFTVADGRITVAPAAGATRRLGAHGRLRLPAGLRRACGITADDRVLLAGEPTTGVLTIYPLAHLDAMLDALTTPPTLAGAA